MAKTITNKYNENFVYESFLKRLQAKDKNTKNSSDNIKIIIDRLMNSANKLRDKTTTLTDSKPSDKEIDQKVKLYLKTHDEFNLSGEKSLFNKYLLYRHSILNDPKKLTEYDKLVKEIIDKVNWSIENFPKENLTIPSNATKYLVSASIVEMYHGRPDLIRKVLNREGGLKIVWDGNINPKEGGHYEFATNTIKLNSGQTIWGVINQNDQHNVIVHEFAHAIDGEKASGGYVSNGIFSEMNNTQKSTFLSEFERLFKQYFRFQFSTPKEKRDTNLTNPDPKSGLKQYAFTHITEFLASAVEAFFETPKILLNASKKIYDIFKDFFKFDPLKLHTGVETAPEREKAVGDSFKKSKESNASSNSKFIGFDVNDWLEFFGLRGFNGASKPGNNNLIDPNTYGAGIGILLGGQLHSGMKKSELREKVYEALEKYTNLKSTEKRKEAIDSFLTKLEAGEKIPGYTGDGRSQYLFIQNLWKLADPYAKAYE